MLPACRECNSFARDLYFNNFGRRLQHVKDKIRKKHAAALRMPIWWSDELDTISSQMRKEVEAWQELRRVTHGRLAWDAISYLRHAVAMRNFAASDAASDRMRDIAVSLLGLSHIKTAPSKDD